MFNAPHFQDHDKARQYLEALRWNGEPVCPHCGTVTSSRDAAEAAFRTATTKRVEPIADAPKAPSLPGAREQVTLRIDRDVLDYFQADGPGWQERINQALRKAAGK